MTSKPNILWVFPDQLRADWIEPIADIPVRTPNVRKLAERGTLFSAAWTPSPICGPARSCIATGTNYDRSPVKHNNQNMPWGMDTLYRRLSEAGYAVSTTGKIDLLKGYMDWGEDGQHFTQDGTSRLFDLGFTRGIDSAGKHDAIWGRMRGASEPYMSYLKSKGLDEIHVADYERRRDADYDVPISEVLRGTAVPPPAYANTDLSPLPEEAYSDNWIGRQAQAELADMLAGDQPWFLVVNFAGPHEPLDVTARMRERWKDVTFPLPVDRTGDDDALQQHIRQNYAAMVELIDDWLGTYVEMLEKAGALENTVVIFASDHGEMLGDLNMWAKSSPFEASVRVPLVIAGPECRAADAPCTAPVSLLDMAATILDMTGCSTKGMEGVSLRPMLETGARPARELVYTGLGNWRAVSDGHYKLVAGFREDIPNKKTQFTEFDPSSISSARLFDLVEDPLERTDIAAANPGIRDRLAAALAADCDLPAPEQES